jgi:hypothetical protein
MRLKYGRRRDPSHREKGLICLPDSDDPFLLLPRLVLFELPREFYIKTNAESSTNLILSRNRNESAGLKSILGHTDDLLPQCLLLNFHGEKITHFFLKPQRNDF